MVPFIPSNATFPDHLVLFANAKLGLIVGGGLSSADLRHQIDEVKRVRLEGLNLISNDAEGGIHLASETDSAKSRPDSLTRIASNLRIIVQALIDLSPLFDDPIADEKPSEGMARVDILTPVANLVALILHIFPKCDKDVATGISNALLQTWTRLRAAGEHTHPRTTEAQTDRESDSRTTENEKAIKPTEPAFLHSAIETSDGAKSSYAEIVQSYQGSSDRPVSIQFPKLPEEGRGGKPFKCETCKKVITVTNEIAWK